MGSAVELSLDAHDSDDGAVAIIGHPVSGVGGLAWGFVVSHSSR